MATGAREPGAGVEPLEDLTDRHPLLGQPAKQLADQIGLGLVDDQMAQHTFLAMDVAVAGIRRLRPTLI